MNVRCVSISATLSARGEEGLTDGMERHVESCLQCRREVVEHRELRRALVELKQATYRAPAEIPFRVMDAIGPWSVPTHAETRDHRTSVAAAAAVATAAATAAAGTAVLLLRHRQRAA